MTIKLKKKENYDELYEKIEAVKANDHEACEWVVTKYKQLLFKAVHLLKRTFRFVEHEELYETTRAFFVQLIIEYDNSKNDNFTNYIRCKLYFRVKEFMCFDYEQTDILHSDRSETVMQYCGEKMYHKHNSYDFLYMFDVMDYLKKRLDAEEIDIFICYYVLRFTQEQIAVITGMTQCPINIKLNAINNILNGYFIEIKENV